MAVAANELRVRARRFSRDWKDAVYEKGDTQAFYEAFFRIFDVERRAVARYEERVTLLDNSRGYIDLHWPGVLLVEQKSAGRSLVAAREQALRYFDALENVARPRYLLLCNFQEFELEDLDEREIVRFRLADLPKYIHKFSFIMGVRQRRFKDQDPVNVRASELVGAIHDGLLSSGYGGEPLQRLMVRLVFCFFAEDTGIFPQDAFLNLIERRTAPDGSTLGQWLTNLFEVLDAPEDARQAHLDEELNAFPYVNDDLFEGALPMPSFTAELRESVLDAAWFNWDGISPAIFGSLFQSIMDPGERRASGAHYTSEQAILKVIEPLFLDELRAEFDRSRRRRSPAVRETALRDLQKKLGSLKLLDPACGCGNFLIVAYRELRELEIAILKRLHPTGASTGALDVSQLSVIDVDQFYGIELNDFACRIAEAALWMMDHIMNQRMSEELGRTFARIPLSAAPHIHREDALEIDWAEVLPASECSYVFGNPPFVGSQLRSAAQGRQLQRVAGLNGGTGHLDYVTAWFFQAGKYVQSADAKIAFVATNSITQGEQVATLWPVLLDRYGLEIAFAHRTFEWSSEARGKAHVHVVVIGLASRAAAPARRALYSYGDLRGQPQRTEHRVLAPYLVDGESLADPNLAVRGSRAPLNGLPPLTYGTQPIDGGNFILDREARGELLAACPSAASLVRPYVGAREFINRDERWILHLRNADPSLLADCEQLRGIIQAVRAFRRRSRSPEARELSQRPNEFAQTCVPEEPFLVIPETSSSRREYVPIGWLEPPSVPSNALRVIEGAAKPVFALLCSAMHNAWLAQIGGRLKSDYRFSTSLVYNTFPVPALDDESLSAAADGILAARARFPDESLANLYDPDLMPADLRDAHRDLDRVVDRRYRRKRFSSQRERVEHLLGMYEQMVAPLPANGAKPGRARRRT